MAEKHVKKLPAPGGTDDKFSSILVLYCYNICTKRVLLNQNLPSIGKECIVMPVLVKNKPGQNSLQWCLLQHRPY